MRYYSTKQKSGLVSLREAVLQGLPSDNGLFMPERIPKLKVSPGQSLADIAFLAAEQFLEGDLPGEVIDQIAREAIDFEAPLVRLAGDLHILELFHGPTLAFKDFGARFMARLMAWLVRNDDEPLTFLVATSGDTGSAVASGFLGVEGIRVVILYPSGKVSPLQEKQLTTLGHNITALEVGGTFDDCQNLVKQAFLDTELAAAHRLSSANSINIARLIPQTFYYLYAASREIFRGKPLVFSVPSGNFGNLCAGVMARRMGAPIAGFIAATNRNDVVPQYLTTGRFQPRPSIATLSNAMDVGNPSNFWRLMDLYGHDLERMRGDIAGFAFSDEATREAMREVYRKNDYVMDPHGAVGYLGWQAYKANHPDACGIVLETAHPAKFLETVEGTLGIHIKIPRQLEEAARKSKTAVSIPANYATFRDFLMQNR
ncbi:MAG: threonine synthase [Saprospiraceae bacterium]